MKLKFILILLTFVMGIASEEFAEYTVQKGDTLSKISQDKLSDPSKWKELLKYNKIDTPNLIRPGLVLKVPDYLSKKKPEPKVEAPKPKVLASLTLFLGDVRFKSEKDKDWSPVKAKQGFYRNGR